MTAHEHGAEIHSAKSSAARVTEQVREHAEQLKDEVRGIGHAAKDLAREKVDAARRVGGELYESGRDRAQEYEDQIVDYVRANPMKSLLIAVAAGVILGAVARR